MADSTTSTPYEVLARKYRPQNFGDVVGQDHVITTLKNAIERNRVHHAYIFVGPRGTGKTSTARILAKALCHNGGPTIEPTDDCDICSEITIGACLDVMEIDGASNNGVEQVREIRDSARFMPSRARYKIYIIDEVHMLSIGAFNALLKILEEPPDHVKFFFATTEPHKVPITILSRCQRFDLKRIPTGKIVQRLQEICVTEKIEAEETALLAVARLAEGGMRDAQSALDQLIAFQGKDLKEEHVLEVFGMVSHERIVDLGAAVLAGDIPQIIEVIAEFDERGKDLTRVIEELLGHLRNLLLFAYTKSDKHLVDLTPSQREAVAAQAADLTPGRVARVVDLILESHDQLTRALNRRVTVEMTLVRAARAASVAPVEQIVRDLHALRDQLGGVAETGELEKKKTEPRVAPTSNAPPPAESKPQPSPRPAPSPAAAATPPSAAALLSGADIEPAEPEPSAAPLTGAAAERQKWFDHPNVKKVLEKFNGDIKSVTPKRK